MIWRQGFYTLSKHLLSLIFGRKLIEDGNRLKIRTATLSDVGIIVDVINSAFRQAESFLIDRDRIDSESVQRLFDKGTFLLTEDDLGAAACVYVEMRGDRSYLGLLSVKPQRQKSGLGSKLMRAAEDYCARGGSRFMDLRIVNVRRELPDFDHRLGYIETGTEPFTAGLQTKIPCYFVNMSKPLV